MISAGQPAQSPPRLASLDVLRGLTVALMILVNNAGDGSVSYAQLRHSRWNGCTLTDVVFPLFLFIAGASIALAFPRRLALGISRRTILLQSGKRSALIFAIGLFLNALPKFDLVHLRFYGVLQRIALCYLIAAMVYLVGRVPACATVSAAALAGCWFLLTHVAIPGLGTPGVSFPLLDPHANLTAWLDRTLLGSAHLYHQGFYDPEGLLSTLPALATTLLGLLSAAWLRTIRPATVKTALLTIAGFVSIAAALLWSPAFPLNKRLWTSSYVLFTAGIAMVLFAALFWLIDEARLLRRTLTPWMVFGTNALAAYIFSEVLGIALEALPGPHAANLQQFLYELLPDSLASPPTLSLVYSVLFVAVCYLPIYTLYRRKLFLKL